MAEDLTARVIRVIAETQHIAADTIKPESTFEQLKIDSLDGINILFALENEFSISIPDEAAREIRSIQQLVDGVRKLIDGAGA